MDTTDRTPEISTARSNGAVAPVLPYQIPPRLESAVEQDSAFLCIRIPPVPSIRQLHPGHLLGIVLPLVIYGPTVISEMAKGISPAEYVVPICIALGVPLIVLLHALDRLTTRTVFEVTHDTLAIIFINSFVGTRRMTWTRSNIHDVKVNPNNGKLVIRAHGREMAEVYLSQSPDVRQGIADLVRNAVFHGKFTAVGIVAPNGKRHAPSATTPLLIAALVIAIAGFILLFIPRASGAGFGIIFLACLMAMIIAGVAFGTQKKDFYV